MLKNGVDSMKIEYEINNLILKIRDYKRSKSLYLNTPIFQKLLDQIIIKKPENLDDKLINIVRIEDKDDFIQIVILNFFLKIFKSFTKN